MAGGFWPWGCLPNGVWSGHVSTNCEACGHFWLRLLIEEAEAMYSNDTSTAPHALLPLPEDDDTLIRRADLPHYLPIAAQTAARWSCEGQGPRFIKVGRRLVAYRTGDLREWLKDQVRENTIAA